MPTNFEPRQLVVPGTILAEGNYNPGMNTYKEGENIFSSVVGLAELRNETVNVIPLRGC